MATKFAVLRSSRPNNGRFSEGRSPVLLEAMKILILSDAFPPYDEGGAERIAYYQAVELKKRGYEVAVFTGDPTRPAPPYPVEPIQQYKAYTLEWPRPRSSFWKNAVHIPRQLINPFSVLRLRQAVSDFKPDIIHAHLISVISFGAFAAVAPHIPKLLTFHGYQFECPKGGLFRKGKGICYKKPLPCIAYTKLMQLTLNSIERIIAISSFIHERLIEAGTPPAKIVDVPNGVPGLGQRSFVPVSRNPNVLFVGRIEQNKGIAELIQSFKSMAHLDAQLTIVGDGSYAPHVRRFAANDKRIVFLGRLSPNDTKKAYLNARLVVVPSLWHEVMNTVICEAQSYGRPVVATALGGNPDLIRDGETGFIYNPSNPNTLSHKMALLLEDNGVAENMGCRAYGFARRFSMATHMEKICALYSEVA